MLCVVELIRRKPLKELISRKVFSLQGLYYGVLLLIGGLTVGAMSPVYAEGSRELITSAGGQGQRPFMQSIYSTLAVEEMKGVPAKTIIKVFAKVGETINLGSSVYAADLGNDIVYRGPKGSSLINGFCDVLNGGFGHINTLAKELAGALPNTGGYTPCTITADKDGIYEIEFNSQPNNPDEKSHQAKGVAEQFVLGRQKEVVAAWDVTVFGTDNLEKKGRVFTNYLVAHMGGVNSELYSQLYFLTNRGYTYRMDLNGTDPQEFSFFANNKGFTSGDKGTGKPLLRSVAGIGEFGKTAFFHSPKFDDDPATDNYTHKMFFNPPALDLPVTDNSANWLPLPDSSLASNRTTWLRTSSPKVPEITNFAFVGDETTPGNAGTNPLGGEFSFETDVAGTYVLTIKMAGNKELLLTGTATAGVNTLVWNGLDALGNPIPPSDIPYEVGLKITVDDVHFPVFDIEDNPKGWIVERLDCNNSGCTVASDIVYYDNGNLSGDTALGAVNPSPATQLDGVSSRTNPAQKFTGVPAKNFGTTYTHVNNGSIGNKNWLDLWTSVSSLEAKLAEGLTIREADLVIKKSHPAGNYQAGSSVTYTIEVTNYGPTKAAGIGITDTFPGTIAAGAAWTCTVSPSSAFNKCNTASGTGNIDLTVDLEKDAKATLSIFATINAGLAAGIEIENTATVTRPDDVTNPSPTVKNAKTESFTDILTLTPSENQVPTVTPPTVPSTPNDTTVLLPALGAADGNGDLDHITITEVPLASQGTLYLGDPEGDPKGTVIVPGTEIKLDKIDELYFEPHPDFVGNATFSYTATDTPGATSAEATVTIPVTKTTNKPPVATPLSVSTQPKTAVKLPPLTATDPEEKPIASFTITPPNDGEGKLYLGDPKSGGTPITDVKTLTLAEVAYLYYEPEPTAKSPSDVFLSYTATDEKGLISQPADILITITTTPNSPPTVDPLTTELTNDQPIQLSLPTAKDPNGDDSITGYTIKTLPLDTEGVLYLGDPNAGGVPITPGQTLTPEDVAKLYFKPAEGYVGTATFTYTAIDEEGAESAPATATLTIKAAPPADGTSTPPPPTGPTEPTDPTVFPVPSTNDDVASTKVDTPVTISILANDNHVDPGNLIIDTAPANGTVIINPDGTVSYTPNPGFVGTDTFVYQVCGQGGQCVTGTVTVSVTEPTVPQLSVDFAGTGEGQVSSSVGNLDCDQDTPDCQASLAANTEITLTATPAAGYEFIGWGGDSDCIDGKITLNADIKCVAYFQPLDSPKFPLRVGILGEGNVLSQPLGIDCGDQCEHALPANTLITLTAVPQPGHEFTGWSGDCNGLSAQAVVTLTQGKTCVANFKPLSTGPEGTQPLSVTKTGSGNGTVTGLELECGPTCNHHYPTGQAVTLTATPDPGSRFMGWGGNCSGTSLTITVTVDTAKSCTALFDQAEAMPPAEPGTETLTVQNLSRFKATLRSEPAGVEVMPTSSYGAKSSANYPIGTVVKLQALPEPGGRFAGWVGDEDCKDGEVTITQGIYCLAVFEDLNPGTVQFSSQTYVVDEFGNPSTAITVSRVGGCDGPITVDYATESGTASHPDDYAITTGTLSWEDGDCSDKTFLIPIKDDKLVEGNETVQLKLSNPTGGATVGAVGEATLTITDDDAPSTNTGQNCYNLAPCQMCCTGCQATDSSGDDSEVHFKTLIATIEEGDTLSITLADGKGDLLLKELPDSQIASLEEWIPIGKGAGRLLIKGVKVGTTKLLLVDSAATSKMASLHIIVIPKDTAGSAGNGEDGNAGQFKIRSILVTIEVGQTTTVAVAGGQGELALSELPASQWVAVDSWIPQGSTGSGELTVTGLQVGTAKAVILDQGNPPEKVVVNVKVVEKGSLSHAGDGSDEQAGAQSGLQEEWGNPYTSGSLTLDPDGNLIIGGIPILTEDDRILDENGEPIQEEYCGEGSAGITAQGETIKSQACFIGKLRLRQGRQPNHRMTSHEEAKEVEVATAVLIDPKHVGEEAEIVLIGVHTKLTHEFRYTQDAGQWVIWNDELSQLPTVQRYYRLPEVVEVPIYKGDLSFAPGEFTVFVGYRLKNGTVIHNGLDPLNFYVGNAIRLDLFPDSAVSTVKKVEQSPELVYDSRSYFEPYTHNMLKGQGGKWGNNLEFMDWENILVSNFLRVDSRHVGKSADILIAATYLGDPKGSSSYYRDAFNWSQWFGELNELQAVQHYHELPETLEIPIYKGSLGNMPGEFIVFVGYQLEEGDIIFNGLDPVLLTVKPD